VSRRLSAVAIALLAVVTGCSSDNGSARTASSASPAGSAPAPGSVAHPSVPRPLPSSGRVVVRGVATLDGAAFDARWVGAVVLRRGLVTPCQSALPPVSNGHYSVTVFADSESNGCGTRGAKVVLWTFARNKILFATNPLAWPGDGRATTFTARYALSTPAGAAPVTAEFNGQLYAADGSFLPDGTRVEAYVGTTRCGVASSRRTADFAGYILAVVGPDSIAGCTRGAHLRFRIDGHDAAPTGVTNTPPGQNGPLDLALR
jgi:hypothetical protein